MRNLFNYIAKYHFFFLFVFLQVISIMLVIQNHHYHRSLFINSSNFLAGNLYDMRNNVVQYFALKSINEQLAQENQALMEKFPESFMKTDQQIFEFRDTLHQKQFRYINAKIINNSVRNRNNYLTINKGSMHGVQPDMGVITTEGVIGIVQNVSRNFSTVMSFLHSETQISAKIKKNNHLGTITWQGYDYQKATMLYIPPHLELARGDTIITSGFSHIFPEGIPIGTIDEFEVKRGDYFFTIEVDLFIDFNQIEYVNIVKNVFRDELTELEQSQ